MEPQPSHRLSLRFGDELELIGFDTRVGREAAVDLTLYWRALKSIPEDYLLALFITDGQGKEEGATMHPQPANYWYPTSKWRSGEVIKVQTMLLPWAPRERDYGLALAVVRGQDPWRVEARLPITVGQATWLVGAAANGSIAELVTVDNDRGLARPVFSPRPGGWQSGSPPADSTLTGSLGEGVRLLGHQFIGEQARAGDTVKLKLWWQVDRPPAGQLTTFVHLLGPDGALAAQGDGPALGGRLPTSFWQAGDLLADEYEIKLPIDLTPGQYTAIVGMYSKEDGKRLGTIDANGVAGDALTLSGSLTVGNN